MHLCFWGGGGCIVAYIHTYTLYIYRYIWVYTPHPHEGMHNNLAKVACMSVAVRSLTAAAADAAAIRKICANRERADKVNESSEHEHSHWEKKKTEGKI